MYQRIWTPHVGEKATTVREPGNEHDRSASNAVMESNTQQNNFYPRLPHFIQISTTLLLVLARFSTISEAEHPSGAS